ncbi:MAG: hypothetical protein RR714_06495 [Aurantimicrobium sp.]
MSIFYPDSINVNIQERRAATDESVRILREMEKEVQQKITDSIRVQNCEIDLVVHTQVDYLNSQSLMALVYCINGKKTRVDLKFNSWETQDKEKVLDKIIQRLSESIASNLLQGIKNIDLKGI